MRLWASVAVFFASSILVCIARISALIPPQIAAPAMSWPPIHIHTSIGMIPLGVKKAARGGLDLNY